jgi:hypothetical protein
MAAMDNDASLVLYSKLLANFGAVYAPTQEMTTSQASILATMKGQLANIQQFLIAVNQQPPRNIYTPAQQQCMSNSCRSRHHSDGQGGGGFFPQQPTMIFGVGAGTHPSTCPPTQRDGIDAILMADMLATPTPAQYGVNLGQCITQTLPAPA